LSLAFAGGGSKGGFEDGAIWQMVRSLNPEDVTYQVLSGVSAGSINLAGIGLFEIGDELNAT
jgi:predicted acylesterase/phospholipase RssA